MKNCSRVSSFLLDFGEPRTELGDDRIVGGEGAVRCALSPLFVVFFCLSETETEPVLVPQDPRAEP